MFKRLCALFAPKQRYTITTSLETRAVEKWEMTPRESFEWTITAMDDSYKSIDDVTGKWISNGIPECEAVLGDHGKLTKYQRGAVKRLTGVDAQTYEVAAMVMLKRLRQLEALGMHDPSDPRHAVRAKVKEVARQSARKAAKAASKLPK